MGFPVNPWLGNPFVDQLCFPYYRHPDWPAGKVKQYLFVKMFDLRGGHDYYIYPELRLEHAIRATYVKTVIQVDWIPANICAYISTWEWSGRYYLFGAILGATAWRIIGNVWYGPPYFYYQGPPVLDMNVPNQLSEPPFQIALGGTAIMTW